MAQLTIDGLRFHSSSFERVISGLDALRPRFRAESRRRRLAFLAGLATEIIDHRIAGQGSGQAPLTMAAKQLSIRQMKVRQNNAVDPDANHSFEISLQKRDGHIYGHVSTIHPDWSDMLRSTGIAEDFSWWTPDRDRPGDVSAGDWERRGRIWTGLKSVDPSTRYGGAGVMFTFLPWEGPVQAAEIMLFLPTPEERARRLVSDQTAIDSLLHFSRTPDKKQVLETIRELRSPQVREALEEQSRIIADRLPKITPELLTGSPRK